MKSKPAGVCRLPERRLRRAGIAGALATCLGGRFVRVQCTPDLLPSNTSGFSVSHPKTHEFRYRHVPRLNSHSEAVKNWADAKK